MHYELMNHEQDNSDIWICKGMHEINRYVQLIIPLLVLLHTLYLLIKQYTYALCLDDKLMFVKTVLADTQHCSTHKNNFVP